MYLFIHFWDPYDSHNNAILKIKKNNNRTAQKNFFNTFFIHVLCPELLIFAFILNCTDKLKALSTHRLQFLSVTKNSLLLIKYLIQKLYKLCEYKRLVDDSERNLTCTSIDVLLNMHLVHHSNSSQVSWNYIEVLTAFVIKSFCSWNVFIFEISIHFSKCFLNLGYFLNFKWNANLISSLAQKCLRIIFAIFSTNKMDKLGLEVHLLFNCWFNFTKQFENKKFCFNYNNNYALNSWNIYQMNTAIQT